ncbi:MAG: hypothetical protein LW860_15860 [Xanthomonadaceae bacterium]|jgi:hypothetical protein|nr:hypothetical protein [Xanthomonadaceae bacterium]
MNPWKDLLFLGGHIATPDGLAALGANAADDVVPPTTAMSEPAHTPPPLAQAAPGAA